MPLVTSGGVSHGPLSTNGLEERFLNVIEAINELPEHKAQRADALSNIRGGGGGGGVRNEKGVSQNYGAENRVLLRAAFTYFFS